MHHLISFRLRAIGARAIEIAGIGDLVEDTAVETSVRTVDYLSITSVHVHVVGARRALSEAIEEQITRLASSEVRRSARSSLAIAIHLL